MATVTPKDDGMTTFVLDIFLLLICWPTVVARLKIRSKNAALGLDDWLMGIGMTVYIMTTAWSGVLIAYTFSGGGYDPSDEAITDELMARALKLYFICQTFYCPTTIPIKVSICVALLRISGANTFYKWALYAIMAITTVSGIGSMLGIVLSCTPPSAFWDPGSGTCNAFVNTFAAYFISACSILTDFALAILPGFMLWNIRLRRSIKVSVGILLGFAAFASCATIVRLRYLLALLDSQNFLLQSGKIAIWTVLELMIGIFAGSAPALRPLLKYLPFISSSETDKYPSGTPGRGRFKSKEIPLETFKTFGGTTMHGIGKESLGQSDKVMQDGDSQEYILQGTPRNTSKKVGVIRKDVSVTVESSSQPGGWDPKRQYYRH